MKKYFLSAFCLGIFCFLATTFAQGAAVVEETQLLKSEEVTALQEQARGQGGTGELNDSVYQKLRANAVNQKVDAKLLDEKYRVDMGEFQTSEGAVPHNVDELFMKDILKGKHIQDYTVEIGMRNKEHALRAVAEQVNNFLQKLLVPVAIVFLVYGGVLLIMSRGDEAILEKQKNQIQGMAIGFSVFLLATVMVDRVFFGYSGTDISVAGSILNGVDPGNTIGFAQEAYRQMAGIFRYFSSFGVLAATAFLILEAFKLLLSLGEEESFTATKRKIRYIAIALGLMISVETVVKLFSRDVSFMNSGIFPAEGPLQVPGTSDTIRFMLDWANFVLGFVGLIGVIALIYAGVRLIANFGDETVQEKAKNIFKYVVIGLVLAFSSWTIVHYVIVAQG